MQDKSQKNKGNNFITLLNFIVDPAVIVDEKGCFLVVNDAFTDLTGLSKKEVIGTAFLNVSNVTAGSKKTIRKNLMKRMKGLAVEPYEINFIDKKGENRYAEVKAKKISYNGQPADLVLFRDITRRKRNAKQLEEYSERMEALVNEKVKEIKEHKEKLETIFNSSPDAITVVDLKGNIIECNEATLHLHGFSSRGELIGRSAFELISSKERQKASMLMASILKKGSVKNVEYSFLTKDGKEFPAEASASVITNAAGKPVGFVTITKDITERKLMEETLQKSEERFRQVADNAQEWIWEVDSNGVYTYASSVVEKVLGYKPEEIVGKKHFYDLFLPEEREELKKAAFQAFAKRRLIREFFNRNVHKNGNTIWLSTSGVPIVDEKGSLLGYRGADTDITERRKMEDALEQERNMLEAATENLGAGLTIISKDYHILWANKFLKQVYGDIEHKLCYLTYERRNEICPNCGVKKVLEEGAAYDAHESSVKDDRGNSVWIELVVTPIKDKDGTVIAALELAVDITEKKLMQNKLAEYSQNLEKLVEKRTKQLKQTQAKLVKTERLAAIGELAAMIGHDLRNPLTGIKGATYYLKTKYSVEIDAKGKEMLKTIDECIDHSNKIINDLLEYSREMKLDLTETNPKTLLNHSLSMIKIPENIQVVDATETEPRIMTDTEKMRRVFVNIIKNAIDAMPDGGTLTITSKAVEDKIAIAFTDTGIGISKENLSKLGSPLFTTKAKGMGFGLPTSKRIIEAHGGQLSVESKIEKGTTVTVTIPVNPKPVNQGEEKWIFNESLLSTTIKASGSP